jgi:hypothetical protein
VELKLSFDRKTNKIRGNLQLVRQAVDELTSSQTLRSLLELILAVGNFVNSVCAAGFNVSDLLKMEGVQCNDAVFITLLHYVAGLLETKPGTISQLCAELEHVPHACRVDMDAVGKQLDVLDKFLLVVYDELMSNTPQMPENTKVVLETYKSELLELKKTFTAVAKDFRALACYFGQDAESTSTLLAVFSKFLENLERAKDENYENFNKYKSESAASTDGSTNHVSSEHVFNKTLTLLKNGSIFRR